MLGYVKITLGFIGSILATLGILYDRFGVYRVILGVLHGIFGVHRVMLGLLCGIFGVHRVMLGLLWYDFSIPPKLKEIAIFWLQHRVPRQKLA